MVLRAVGEFTHNEILTENHPKVRQTANLNYSVPQGRETQVEEGSTGLVAG